MCLTSDHVLQILQKTGAACIAVEQNLEQYEISVKQLAVQETVLKTNLHTVQKVRKQLNQPILKLGTA